jgi:hypothetical protein
MRDIHEEEPYSQKERDRQDEWWEQYNRAIKAGFSEDEAKEIANTDGYHHAVGDEAYYGVSRSD